MPERERLSSSFDCLIQDKEVIYSIIFYCSGLLLGSLSFSLFNSTAVIKLLSSLFSIKANGIIQLFAGNFSIYISVFMITVFTGMFLIGYPLINVVPLVTGTAIAIKTTYYFTQFGAKGIGYSLLMIIPEAAAFITVIIYTIKTSTTISKYIQCCAASKACDSINIKSLLKQYAVYASAVTLTALINAVLTYLIGGIIKI